MLLCTFGSSEAVGFHWDSGQLVFKDVIELKKGEFILFESL